MGELFLGNWICGGGVYSYAEELAKGVVKIRAFGDCTESEVPSVQVLMAVRDYFKSSAEQCVGECRP